MVTFCRCSYELLFTSHTACPEPGYYADGQFGIRIENVVIVREVQTPNNFGNKGYLGFEHVTMVSAIRVDLYDSDCLHY